ncbi:MAG: DUF6179 domain-containing protein [Erysipelotrichia bacterium]|nr:DUF6179 domain-containing protein [Erysipelotrichia bacterium]
MMNLIVDKILFTDEIDHNNYFIDLLNKAKGVLNSSELNRISREWQMLLYRQTEKYLAGRSSSITIDKVKQISKSLIYVLSLELKRYEKSNSSWEILQKKSLEAIFDDGLNLIENKKRKLAKKYRKLLSNLLETKNTFYNETITKGIKGFLKLYNGQFQADEIHITADYPVCAELKNSLGIEFMEEYLNCLAAENEFCLNFDSRKVERLLEKLNFDYINTPFNIFEIVLINVIGLRIVDGDIFSLNLDGMQKEQLKKYFHAKSKKQIKQTVGEVIKELSDDLKFNRQYLFICVDKICELISCSFDNVFIADKKDEILIIKQERMENRDFERVTHKLMRVKNKVAVIVEEVRSIDDLMDIISVDILSAEQCLCLVQSLSLEEVAVLSCYYCDEVFLHSENEIMMVRIIDEFYAKLSMEEREIFESIVLKIKKLPCDS